MSAPKPQRSPSTNAKEVMAIAGSWIVRRDHSEWNAQDRFELDAWLAESPSHMIAYLRLEDIWQRANRLKALKHPQRGGLAMLQQWVLRPLIARMAAIFVVASLVAVGGRYYLSAPAETTYATSAGGHKILTLADGSKIELNTDTIIRVSRTGQQQSVRLEKGETFFQIKHDPARSFVVLAGDHRITDIGTEFLVRSEPNRLEVALVEGRVRFDTPDGQTQSPILLTSGVALVVANNLITTMKKAPSELSSELAWRHGMLVFDKVPLGQVAAEFNRYGGKQIVIADVSIAKIPVSATFPTNGVDGFVELAKAMLGLRVNQHDQEIDISR